MNETARELQTQHWRESHAVGEEKAVAHAWIQFERQGDSCVVIKANRREALRIQIKYHDTGPYLAIEEDSLARTGETMGACVAAGEMARRYAHILEAHNTLGDLLHSARSFLITDEEKERAKRAADTAIVSTKENKP